MNDQASAFFKTAFKRPQPGTTFAQKVSKERNLGPASPAAHLEEAYAVAKRRCQPATGVSVCPPTVNWAGHLSR